MATLKFIKDGLEVKLSSNSSNVFINGESLDNKLQAATKIVPAFTSGIKIATIMGTDIYAPATVDSASVSITGAVYFNTFADLKNSTVLKEGGIAITKGFYEVNDGGGSTFNIIKSLPSGCTEDGATLVKLANGLYADLMLPVDDVINFRLFGALNLTTTKVTDNKPYILKYMDFCDRYECTFTLYIPSGTWCFSPTEIIRNKYPEMGVSIRGDFSSDVQYTSIMCMNKASMNNASTCDYVWKFGSSTKGVANNTIIGLHIAIALTAYSIGFHGGLTGTTVWGSSCLPEAYIVISNSHNDYWDLIKFHASVCSLKMYNSHNIKFGFTQVIGCGGGHPKGIWMFGDNVYNVIFDYTNYESSYATLAYGYSTDNNSLCLLVFNDILFEGLGNFDLNSSTYKYSSLNKDKLFFVLDGHLGSEGHPTIVNTFTATKFNSTTYLDSYLNSKPAGADDSYLVETTSPDVYGRVYYKYFGGKYGGALLGLVGHGVTSSASQNIIVNNLFTNTNVSEAGPFYIYDLTSGGKFTLNQNTSKDSKFFHLENASCPIINMSDANIGLIYAYQCGNVKVSTKSGATSPFNIVGTLSSSEYYEFFAKNGKTYKMRFNTYLSGTTSTRNYSGITILAYNSSTNAWDTIVSNGSISASEDGWTTVSLPSMNLSSPKKIRIKGLPKYVDYFYC